MSETQLYIKSKHGLSGGHTFLAVNHSTQMFVTGNTKNTEVTYQKMKESIYVDKLSDINQQKNFYKANGYRNVITNVFNKHI